MPDTSPVEKQKAQAMYQQLLAKKTAVGSSPTPSKPTTTQRSSPEKMPPPAAAHRSTLPHLADSPAHSATQVTAQPTNRRSRPPSPPVKSNPQETPEERARRVEAQFKKQRTYSILTSRPTNCKQRRLQGVPGQVRDEIPKISARVREL